ncbi:MAG: GNAT family N-acetyltransferase [Planctomycetota bacterium]
MSINPVIQPGSRRDYHALAPHHYRPGHPATSTRVLSIYDPKPTPTDRLLGQPGTPRPLAVLVESLASLSCVARNVALSDRYAGLPVRGRARALNAEVRCISRVIVDPRVRGRGYAAALVRHALATATTPVTEALAAMGHASPFFERAGMTRIDQPTPPRDRRLLDAMHFVGLDPAWLAMPSRMAQQIDALPHAHRALLDRELVRWYRSGIGRGDRDGANRPCCLAAAQGHLLSRPIYYIHHNPPPDHAATDSTAHRPAPPPRQRKRDAPGPVPQACRAPAQYEPVPADHRPPSADG